MRHRLLPVGGWLLVAACACNIFTQCAGAQELVDPVDVRLTLLNGLGEPVERAIAGQPLTLRLELSDRTSRSPRRGLMLTSFLRPHRPDVPTPSCQDLSRGLRATGSIANGDIDLTGVFVTVRGTDNRIAVIDPRINLASAQTVALFDLPPDTTETALDTTARRFLAVTPRGVLGRGILGGVWTEITEVPKEAHSIVSTPQGLLHLARDRLHGLAKSGRKIAPASDTAVAKLIDTGPSARGGGVVIAVTRDNLAIVLDRNEWREIGRTRLRTLDGLIYSREANAVLAGDREQKALVVSYLGDMEPPSHQVRVGFSPNIVAAAPNGPIVLAAGEDGTFAAIDMATSRLIQAATFDNPVTAIKFSGDDAFLAFQGRIRVGVIALSSIKAGDALAVRRTELGVASNITEIADAPLIVSLAPVPGVLASGPDPANLFFVMGSGAHANAPSSSIRLRTGPPVDVQVIDRAFREGMAGRYETSVVPPHSGAYTLLVSSGGTQLLRCFSFEAEGGTGRATPLKLHLVANATRLSAKDDSILSFRLEGDTAQTVEPSSIVAASLVTHWSQTAKVTREDDGRLEARLQFPGPGNYPISLMTKNNAMIGPMFVEVLP